MMHIGVDTTLSKTKAMCFPPPRVGYSNADASRFDIRNADCSAVCFVGFTKEFKYFCSIIDPPLYVPRTKTLINKQRQPHQQMVRLKTP